MELQDVKTAHSYELQFELTGSPSLSGFKAGWAQASPAGGSFFNISQGNTAIRARLEHPEKAAGLFADADNGAYLLTCVTSCIPGKVLQARVTALTDLLHIRGDLAIACSRTDKRSSLRDVADDLRLVKDKDQTYVLAAPLYERNDSEDGKDDDGVIVKGKGFYLIGHLWHLAVHRVEDHGFSYYRAKVNDDKAMRKKTKRLMESPGRIFLVRVNLFLNDEVQHVRNAVRAELEARMVSGNSYVDLWTRYLDAAWRLVCRKASSQLLNVRVSKKEGGMVELSFDSKPSFLGIADHVSLYEGAPPWKADCADPQTAKKRLQEEALRSHALLSGEISALDDNRAVLATMGDAAAKLSDGGEYCLTPDMNMDVMPLLRSNLAQQAIREGTGANPFLAGIIDEESDYCAKSRRNSHVSPLSVFVEEKLFGKRQPTEKQRQAIDIALNTPDVALIQGPPGTGKTTVITAILERLNELQDKSVCVRGSVLVTSFQHDAVNNIIDRLSINSLPTLKFGLRVDDPAPDEQKTLKRVEEWSQKLRQRMEERYPQLAQEGSLQAISQLSELYRLRPSRHLALELLKRLRSDASLPISREMRENRVAPLYKRLSDMTAADEAREDLRPAIWGLHVTRTGFTDGEAGWLKAKRLLDTLKNAKGLEREKAVLEEASKCWEEPSEELLAKLRRTQVSLLQRFTPPPEFSVEKADESVLELLGELRDCLATDETVPQTREEIVAALHHALVHDPEGIQESIMACNYVFAATNQQCVGRDMAKAKGAKRKRAWQDEDDDSPFDPALFYDTVVVDEAAKSAPPDLMIPMSLARRRIILVGDHRQLPHMIDELVEEEMLAEDAGRDDSAAQEKDADQGKKLLQDRGDLLKVSMFAILKKRLKALEAKDGIRRTITLDEQFRTHPVLGELVSRYFYEPWGEGYRSPRPAKDFSHFLPGAEGRACVWISAGHDGPSRSGTSLCNREEAERVVHWLQKWMDSEAGRGLTFGVISFYKAQIQEIMRVMGNKGMRRDGTITDAYHYLEPKVEGEERRERLRIGTVDSFQGMEFDIVILSMVRTSRSLRTGSAHPFGFLENPNRLCVALSRQKKMLAIAGDERLVNSAECRERKDTVAILFDFYAHCQQEGEPLT